MKTEFHHKDTENTEENLLMSASHISLRPPTPERLLSRYREELK